MIRQQQSQSEHHHPPQHPSKQISHNSNASYRSNHIRNVPFSSSHQFQKRQSQVPSQLKTYPATHLNANANANKPLSMRSGQTTTRNHYRQPQQEQETDIDFFGLLFNCCRHQQPQPQIFVTKIEPNELYPPYQSLVKKDEPYMSQIRMKSRQMQPNNIYNETLVSQKLTQSRWTYER